MLRPRIIPCLLVYEGDLVKTKNFIDPKYIGDPINAVKIFNEKEVDELIVLDIGATSNCLEPNFNLIKHLASECRMPLCYGGGIQTVQQAKDIIRLGVEKVALSSAVIENPNLISLIAKEIGSQSVVVILDIKKNFFGKFEIFTHNGKVKSSKPLFEFVIEAELLGAGELVINSIDCDGQMKGYDLALAKKIRSLTNLPLTILGGAGSITHINDLIGTCGLISAAAGSLFVFKGPYRAVLISYLSEKQKDLLNTVYAKINFKK